MSCTDAEVPLVGNKTTSEVEQFLLGRDETVEAVSSSSVSFSVAYDSPSKGLVGAEQDVVLSADSDLATAVQRSSVETSRVAASLP